MENPGQFWVEINSPFLRRGGAVMRGVRIMNSAHNVAQSPLESRFWSETAEITRKPLIFCNM
ncbi:MAG: hypothetical protein ACRCTX_07230, partial [Afipia sp.]